MPMPTPAEFWTLVAETGLVDRDRLDGLRHEFDLESLAPSAAPDAVTEAIAKWLVRRKVVTVWQARRLARGDRGPFFIGDYRLLERLEKDAYQGAGSKGTLFRARHEPSGRGVCLMLLDATHCRQLEVWTDIVRRTTAANQAKDPLLSRTWALEQSGAQRFIVCEDVVGPALGDELAARGPRPIAEVGPLMVAIARAVGELHRLGVVHGGISLASLRREPAPAGAPAPAGRVRLLQFPLVADPHAVPLRPPLDVPEAIRGLGSRASFIAPELSLPGAACDPHSDVYALGCVFHALLTGAPPCWQGDPERTLAQAMLVGPEPLGPSGVPVEVATLVSYMVARDPAARYANAAEAADAIAACLGMPPVSPTLPAQQPFLGPAAPALATPAPAGISTEAASSVAPRASDDGRRRVPSRHRSPVPWIGLGLAAASLAVAVGGIAYLMNAPAAPERERPAGAAAKPAPAAKRKPTAEGVEASSSRPDSEAGEPAKPAVKQATASAPLVVDSEDAAWASPTQGPPPTLSYLPPGSQLILLARPADMLLSREGKLFVQSLGPRVAAALETAAALCGCRPEGIEFVQAGWQADETKGPEAVVGGFMIRGVAGLPVADDPEKRRRAWGDTKPTELDGETIYAGAKSAYWLPAAEAGRVLVVGPESLFTEELIAGHRRAIENRTRPGDWREKLEANLPPEMEDLVGMLDETRQLTILGSPAYLLHDGRPVLAGPLEKLVEPLGEFFGEQVHAAALSVQCGVSFYLELDCIAPASFPARKLSPALAAKTKALADTVEEYCNALDPHPYGRKLVMRLPRMLGILAANVRVAAEGKGVVVNCHLPEHAGHNLALAAELALEQSPLQAAVAGAPGPAAGAPQSVGERLKKKISLVFIRDTLEKSIQMISDEIGVPIEILGKDLELEGITKNQSFGLSEQDQTADAILRTILARSNIDGKLVYVIRNRDGMESIEITTRAAAAKRGDTLPAGFEKTSAADTPAESKGTKSK